KNKVAPPFREAEFDILYGKGISRDGEIVDLGADAGIVEKSGSWYAFEGERIGQGRENAKDFLHDHADVAEKIEATIRAKLGVPAKGGQRAAAAAAGATTGAAGAGAASAPAEAKSVSGAGAATSGNGAGAAPTSTTASSTIAAATSSPA